MESTDIKQEPQELGVSVIKDELSDLEMIKDDLLINIDIPECIENSSYFHNSSDHTDFIEDIPLNQKMNELYCDRCNFSTNSKIIWNDHLQLHREEDIHSCDKCGFRTINYNSMQKHKLFHTTKKLYKCPDCGLRTRYKCTVNNHKMMHLNIKPFQCNICKYSTRSKQSLKNHTINLFQCDICNYSICTKRFLKDHKIKNHNMNLFQCDICDFITYSKPTFKYHKKTHKKLFNCDVCKFQTSCKSWLGQHMLLHQRGKKILMTTHYGADLFQCDICNFISYSEQTLKYHNFTHHNALFHCDVCKFETRSKSYLEQHMLLHQNKNKKLKEFEGINIEENVTKVCRICLQKIGKGVKFHYLNTKGLKLQWKLTDSLREFDLNPVICNPCVTEMIGTESTTKKLLPFTNDIKEERDGEGSINVTEQEFLSCVKQEPGVEIIKEVFGMGMIKEEVTLYPPAPISIEKPTYHCHDCGYGTKTKKYLVQHIFKHHKKTKFQCNYNTEKKHYASNQVPSSS